jgi:hypothetical protein
LVIYYYGDLEGGQEAFGLGEVEFHASKLSGSSWA